MISDEQGKASGKNTDREKVKRSATFFTHEHIHV